MTALGWWRSAPPRLRRRRRLLMFSAPVAVLMVAAILKLCSVVIAGGSAPTDYAKGDAGALRGDVATLDVLNVVEPAKAFFAAGALAVLDGRLEDADARFGQALAHTEQEASCPVRVNLELVRETLGDKAAGALNVEAAVAHYLSALSAVEECPRRVLRGQHSIPTRTGGRCATRPPPYSTPRSTPCGSPHRHRHHPGWPSRHHRRPRHRRRDPHQSNRIRDCDLTRARAIRWNSCSRFCATLRRL